MSGMKISLELAKDQLREFLPSESPAATVDSIQKLVANYYDLKVSDLKSRNNSQQVAMPRQVAMYLSKQLTSCSLPDLGRRFGGKHHSTVIHAIQKITKKRTAEREFDNLIDSFMQSLK
jgi:chromosomal replication initiator protein